MLRRHLWMAPNHIAVGRELENFDKIQVAISSAADVNAVKERLQQYIERDADWNIKCSICGKEGIGKNPVTARCNLEKHIETHLALRDFPFHASCVEKCSGQQMVLILINRGFTDKYFRYRNSLACHKTQKHTCPHMQCISKDFTNNVPSQKCLNMEFWKNTYFLCSIIYVQNSICLF